MVLLTMTPAAVRALSELQRLVPDELAELSRADEPSLDAPAAGQPISHGQLIDLAGQLKQHADRLPLADGEEAQALCSLDALLKGSQVYVAPPPPKKEPTPEFKALMARLRAEEEARAYDRMLNPPAAAETFAQRFPVTAQAHFDPKASDFEDDDVSYEEVHRQIVLIINVLVSIIGCAVFIWMAAWHWSAPSRLGLSMGGSLLIAVAEVIIYNGYLRRVKEAKTREKKKPEIRKIVQSWIIDSASDKETAAQAPSAREKLDDGVRYRKGKHR